MEADEIILATISISLVFLLHFCAADVGTATAYGPPYVPSSCYGSDRGQFPAGNRFAAANDAIWDNQAACGRKYRVRCLSGTSSEVMNPCRERSLVVKIVDYCSSSGCDNGDATFHLSTDAFAHIAHPSARKINIEYDQ
ncbi:hypothetical protein KI387_022648 [Taxus chinensis]|uniref:Expansin-like EG45 domain-containing protein n=1 Tax=Taxus chinensis TaxID=29808 RepID=A0AA38G0Z8_TAXCH|nr:hypothetical protein KI387_022648 [Taxus chinensis]